MAAVSLTKFRPLLKATGLMLVILVAVVGLMLWLMGYFHPKISETGGDVAVALSSAGVELATVQAIRVPMHESAVGSVQPVHESAVASKILAKVMQVNVTAGKRVSKGDLLVVLDDGDLKARRQQAAAAVEVAKAARDQAKLEFERVMKLSAENAAAAIEVERTTTAFKSAEAELLKAQQGLNEAEIVLSYAKITSPLSGVIIDKRIEAGDTVRPGDVLLTLYDPTRMQLIASVRESLTYRLKIGQEIPVEVAALGHACAGEVSEIVPEAQTASRSFQVKVTGPCPPGVYPGMFGRLLIPLDEERILVIPRQAVRRVGQLDVVEVAEGPALHRRIVQLGRNFGENVEVLSGLKEGEKVALSFPPSTRAAPAFPPLTRGGQGGSSEAGSGPLNRTHEHEGV